MQNNNVIIKGKRVLIPFESGYATGWKEGPAVLEREPIARPKFKLPYALWRESLAFLADVFLHKKWEAQLLWFRHSETGEWKTYCPVQTGSGASTRSIDCVENDNSLNFLSSNGFDCVGSIHSHCTMPAFQSGTDKDDELGQTDGFHVTIGKMNDDIFDVHCRSIITLLGDTESGAKAERDQIQFYLEDFIDGVPNYDESPFPISSRIRKELTKEFLLSQQDLGDYDEAWCERIIDLPKPVYNHNANHGRMIQGVQYITDQEQAQRHIDYWNEKRQREWEKELEEEDEALKRLEEAEQDDEVARYMDEQGRIYGMM
jgi:hypothetical protein